MADEDKSSETEEEVKTDSETEQVVTDPQGSDETKDPAEQIKRMEAALKKANSEAAKSRKELEKLQAAEKERRDAELSETDRLKQQLEEAQKKARQLELNQWKLQAAQKAKLPVELAPRLQGETLEELETDAATLAEKLPKQMAQKPDPTNPGRDTSGNTETAAQRRARLYGSSANIFDPVEAAKHGGGVIWPTEKSE